MLRVTMANIAGGRLVDAEGGGYAPSDQTGRFAEALAASEPDVLIVTELDCGPGSEQLARLAGRAMGRPAGIVQHPWSDSHIPGVAQLGVGVAARHPLRDTARVRLPEPPFEMLHWSTGERLEWHPKGLLVSRCRTPEGELHIVAGQIHPIHMARSAEGVEYSYQEGTGREYGRKVAEFLNVELARLGVRRAIIAGDLNMPDPREFFTNLGEAELVDVFGRGDPPATTPDGRSIDRAFLTEDLRPKGYEVVRLRRADHYPVSFRVGIGGAETTPPRGAPRPLSDTPTAGPPLPPRGSRASSRGPRSPRNPPMLPERPRRRQ